MQFRQEFSARAAKNAHIKVGTFLRIFAQLLLIMGATYVFSIEERVAFVDYFGILLPVAFLVHAWLPLKFRLPFFVFTTVGVILWIFGATSGMWFLLIGLSLIGICHLRIPFKVRVAALLAVVALLASIHIKWIPATSKLGIVIPALGAMFMFRLAIYLYDIRHEKGPVSIWQRLAYFFLLPNPVFTLFPVIDYKTFLKSHYQKDAAETYQKGVLWIARGVVHFILYRLVTNYLSPVSSEVTSIGVLAVFVLSSYLIYLRMSGLFHLIAGMLCLFGFNLPHTHRFYLLATGFNDYWQRINIYWKDMMMKLVYYPVFTSLKKLGVKNMTAGIVIATASVFFITWIVHWYQSFWMRMDARVPMLEDMGLLVVDGLFWGIFGVLVIINSLFTLRNSGAKSLKKNKEGWSFVAALKRAMQIAAMFVLMCMLWSLWQSPNIGEWLGVLAQAKNAPLNEVGWIVGLGGLAILIGVGGQFLKHRGIDLLPESPSEIRATVSVVTSMLILIAFGLWHQRKPFDGKTGEVADAMRGIDVREQAQINLERGYYEGLLSPDDGYAQMLRSNFSDFQFRGKIERPEDFPENKEQWMRTGDLRHKAYKSNATGLTVGKSWQTNQWGLRDKEYTKEKPDDVYRIAVLGASYTMGRGVEAEDDFESQLEILLNEEGVASKTVEILNFATTAYSTIESTYVCEHIVPQFQPDAVFLIAHGVEALRCTRKLAKFMTDPEVELSYNYLKDLKRKARVSENVSETENLRRLEPYAEEILQWLYQRIGDSCRANGIKPVWVFLPTTKRISRTQVDVGEMGPLADKAGLARLVIEEPYRRKAFEDIILNEWDAHPNEKSHRDIAEQFLKTWRKEQERLDLGLEIRKP